MNAPVDALPADGNGEHHRDQVQRLQVGVVVAGFIDIVPELHSVGIASWPRGVLKSRRPIFSQGLSS